MDEFLALKKEVVMLLNQNIHGPELEKIDITEFYLHTKLKEHKEQLCEKECEWTVKYYKELIRSQTELWACMKKKFWDSQEIKRSTINGILCNFYVENYGMVPLDPKFQFTYNYVTMFREFEEMLRDGDLFSPWVPKTVRYIRSLYYQALKHTVIYIAHCKWFWRRHQLSNSKVKRLEL